MSFNQLDSATEKWSLHILNKITSTNTSEVFLVNSPHGKAVLKILNKIGLNDEIDGFKFLDVCQSHGALKVFDYNDNAILMEYLEGEDLYQFSKENNEKKATEIIANIIKKIQDVELDGLKTNFRPVSELFDKFRTFSPPEFLISAFQKATSLCEILENESPRNVLLHGDLHHENIKGSLNGDFFFYDPKGFIGDPSYELATVLKNPWNYPSVSQNILEFENRLEFFSQELSLPRKRIIGYCYVHFCLSLIWALEDSTDFKHQKALLDMISPLVNMN